MARPPLIYLIESGPFLVAAQQHVVDRLRVQEAAYDLAREYGADKAVVSYGNGVLSSVVFPSGKHHPDFTQPRRGWCCYPRRKTEAEERFKAQVGYRSPHEIIQAIHQFPYTLSWNLTSGHGGFRRLGSVYHPTSFVFPHQDGPYALAVPDFVGESEDLLKEHPDATIEGHFDPNVPGCRRILQEEWNVIVAQRELLDKQEELAAERAPQ